MALGGNGRDWRQDVECAAAGILAAVALELLLHRPRPRGAALTRVLVAGGLAGMYGRLVPAPNWGARSGAAFAQLPPIAATQARLDRGEAALPLAAWGALTGGLLRLLHPGRGRGAWL